jgi:hypothetical protein
MTDKFNITDISYLFVWNYMDMVKYGRFKKIDIISCMQL